MGNIVIVGFMGTGKTVVAKALARQIGKKYVSVDGRIEAREKRKINDIFHKDGEPYFRKIEKETVKDLSKKNDQVIDTGGGVVLDEQNMKALKSDGIVICLWAEPEVIYDRTQRYSHRPLLKVDDPRLQIKELLKKRRPYYEKADFHINTTGLSIATVVDRIETIIKKKAEPGKGDIIKPDKDNVLKEVFFKKLLGNISAFVMVSDSKGSVVFANKRCLDFFGLSEKGIIDSSWITRIIPSSERKDVQKIFDEIKKKKTIFWFNASALTPYSSEKRLLWLVIPIKRERAVLYMFVGGEESRAGGYDVKKHALTPEESKITYQGIVEMLFDASSVSEPWLADHASRVASLAVALAKKIKMSRMKIERLKLAAILHDLGKLGIDRKILLKKGKLTKGEFDQMKKHSRLGAEAAHLVYFLNDMVFIIISHHENYDGSGYPRKLKGQNIPLEARVLSIADIYEALTSDRPYRKKFSVERAIGIIDSEKGRKLDPKLTDIFLDMVRSGKLEKNE